MALTGLTMAEGFRDQGNDVLIKGGEMDIFSLGLTWWLSDIFGMKPITATFGMNEMVCRVKAAQ